MMYPYLTLANEIEVTHSHLIEQEGSRIVEVHFERAIPDGFQSARCQLPYYTWKFNDGFSTEQILFFEELLMHNARLIFRYASERDRHHT